MLAEIMMLDRIPKRVKNLIGTKFGYECIVIGYVKQNTCRQSIWLCRCKCNNEFRVPSFKITNIKYGLKSCPLCSFNNRLENTVPMIGKKFGRWLVLQEYSRTKNRSIQYLCICDCGIVKDICGTTLRQGQSKSCGCFQKEVARSLCGPKSSSWNPNMNDEDRQLQKERYRLNDEIIKFRKQVFQKDNYTCQCCGKKGGQLNAHHLNAWNKFKDQRYDLHNGITLCVACHKLFHKKHGSGDNTKQQYQDFIVNLYNG